MEFPACGKNQGTNQTMGSHGDIPGSVFIWESHYPQHYERKMFTNDGTLVSIRPIKPTDNSLLIDFFKSLSAETVFFRFLRYLRTLPPEWVERFTQIDYDRDVAIVAVIGSGEREQILGVCRIMRRPGATNGEIAVVVGDTWQRNGIGSVLLKHCIQIARELGITSLWALVSGNNSIALTLAERFGFSQKVSPGLETTELEKTLE